MCWLSKNTPIKRIAEKDIYVEKILYVEDRYTLHSPLRNFKWKYNKIYTSSIGKPCKNENYWFIQEGFHSCEKIILEEEYWISLKADETFGMFCASPYENIYPAVIPKGSHYYINEYGNYVSDKLKIIKSNSYEN